MNRIPLRQRSSLLPLCGLLLLLVRPLLAGESATATIPLWGRFEMAVTNMCNYGNPFVDVTPHATFARPDRSRVSFWGYHDGDGHGGQTGGVWRLVRIGLAARPRCESCWRVGARDFA
ncbi:MAG TPA: DUF5060 domain-containing protein [Candidatus Paceibacterota bacterium]|nr:DUF5060 domain-containing protein [Candidatus Paceibacterota bacterium]